MIFRTSSKIQLRFMRREFLVTALLSGVSAALHAESVPQLAVLEQKWAPSLVWIYFQSPKHKIKGARRESIKSRHLGFYISSSGWILASVPQGETGDALIVEHQDGQRRRGKITHHGLQKLVLIEEKLLPHDIPAAIPFAEAYFPHRDHWLYGVALHAEKGHPLVAAGGLSYQRKRDKTDLSTEKDGFLLQLEMPLWPGTPIFHQNQLVAVCSAKINSKKISAIGIKRVRHWLQKRP